MECGDTAPLRDVEACVKEAIVATFAQLGDFRSGLPDPKAAVVMLAIM